MTYQGLIAYMSCLQLEIGVHLMTYSLHQFTNTHVPTKNMLYACFLHRTNVQTKFVHNMGI